MYIFVCSPGRSGTKFISEIFKKVTNIPSYHGGEPKLREIIDNRGHKESGLARIEERVKLIKRLAVKDCYFESSQIFIHTLSEKLVKEKMKPLYVINLLRDPMEVAVSYTNRNSFPSDKKNNWRLPLNSKEREVKVNRKLSIFQENLLDWIDCQVKLEKTKNRYEKVINLRFEDLNNIERLEELFNILNLKYDKKALRNFIRLDSKKSKNENKKKTIIEKKYLKERDDLLNILQKENNQLLDNILQKFFVKNSA